MGPACAKVKKGRTAKHYYSKQNLTKLLQKRGIDKLLYARGDAKRSDYKITRKSRRNIRKHRPLHAIKLIND